MGAADKAEGRWFKKGARGVGGWWWWWLQCPPEIVFCRKGGRGLRRTGEEVDWNNGQTKREDEVIE